MKRTSEDIDAVEIDLPSEFRAVFIPVFVLAFGVIWEVFEFGLSGCLTLLVSDLPFASSASTISSRT